MFFFDHQTPRFPPNKVVTPNKGRGETDGRCQGETTCGSQWVVGKGTNPQMCRYCMYFLKADLFPSTANQLFFFFSCIVFSNLCHIWWSGFQVSHQKHPTVGCYFLSGHTWSNRDCELTHNYWIPIPIQPIKPNQYVNDMRAIFTLRSQSTSHHLINWIITI